MHRFVAAVVAGLLAAGCAAIPLVRRVDPPSRTPADVAPPTAPGTANLPTTAAAEHPALSAAVEAWIAGRADTEGVVVAVARTGSRAQPWLAEAARPGADVPLDDDETYGVLSITKTFTEALVLRAVQEGLIDLDRPMPDLPGVEPAPAGTRITPRMLLQHSSGLVDYKSAPGYDPGAAMTPERIVSLGLSSPLMSEPGTQASYSNTNFHWLGLLVEHVTGRTYAQLVDDLASEFGLPDTSVAAPSRPGWVGFASGGVMSTAADIARWAAALFTPGRVLDAERVELLTEMSALGVTHGLWPVCGCAEPTGGAENQPALAQLVANGGVVFYPEDGLVVVVRREEADGRADLTVAVADSVRAAVSRGAAPRQPRPRLDRRAS